MARFELGAAWVGVHADTSRLRPEVKQASDEASRTSQVTVKVAADEQKLDRLKRKAEDLGLSAARASLAHERAQLAVNKAQERYDALLKDEKASQDDRALALNRVQEANLRVEAAVRKVANVERDRHNIARETEVIMQRISDTVHKSVDTDVDRLGSRIKSGFRMVGEAVGKVMKTVLSEGLEAGVEVGVMAFKELSKTGVAAARTIGTAMAEGVATTGATGGINLLVGAVLAAVGAMAAMVVGFLALAPVLQMIAGGFGVAGGAAIALVSIFGTVKLAFSGVMDAMQAHSAMQDEVGQSGQRMASQERSNAVAIRNAQQAIGDARRQAQDVAEQSAKRITDAQKALARAHEDAAERVRDASRRIVDAQEDLAEAHEQAADLVVDAEERLAEAAEDSREAQARLNEERADAVERIKDLAEASVEASFSLERAEIRLIEAQEKRAEVEADSTSTDLERRKALLAVEEATFNLTQAQEKAAERQVEATAAAAAGVEGDRQVVAAKKAVDEATRAQTEAQAGITEAQREGAKVVAAAELAVREAKEESAKVQRDAAESVTAAEGRLQEARQAGARAQEDANRAVDRATQALADLRAQQADAAQAMNAGSAAASKYARAMAELTPAGRAFVAELLKVKALLDRLKATAETAMLPGVTSFLKDASTLFPIVNGHIKNMGAIIGGVFADLGTYFKGDTFKAQLSTILGSVERFTASIGRAGTAVLPAFVSIVEAASPLLERFGKWIERIAVKFADWIETNRRSGELKKFFDGVGDTFGRIAKIGGLVFDIISDVIEILFPASKSASGGVLDGIILMLEGVKKWLLNEENKRRLKEWIDELDEKVKKFAKDVKDFIEDVKDIANELKKWIDKFDGWAKDIETFVDRTTVSWDELKNATKAAWGWIFDRIKGVLDDIKSVTSGALDAVRGFFASAGEKIKAAWDSALSWVKAKGDEWLTKIKNAVSGGLDAVRGFFASMWDKVQAGWDAGFSWIKSKADSWISKIKSAVSGIKDHFVSVIGNLASALVSPANKVISVINTLIGKVNAILPKSLDIPVIGTISTTVGTWQNKAIGGPIVGPGTGTSDDVPIMASNGEYMLRAAAVKALGLPLLDRLNQADHLKIGGDPDTMTVRPRFAAGGIIGKTQQWLRGTADPLPYVFGSVGPNAYDCSGITGEVFARLTGRPSYRRYHVTSSNFEAQGWRPGRGTYTIGVGPGHMAGNLAGLAFEAANSADGIFVGSGAQSVTAFPRQYYLPQIGDQFVGGGGGLSGPSLSSMVSALVDAAAGPFRSLLSGLGNDLPARSVRGVFEKVPEGIKARTASFDQGGPLHPGFTLAYNGTGRTEQVSTADQAQQAGGHYHFAPGSIVLDASKLRSIQDLVDLVGGLKSTARQFGAATVTVG